MNLMQTYRAASQPIRRQFRFTAFFAVAVIVYSAVRLYASTGAEPAPPSSWFTPQNVLAAVALVYGAGMLREQFAEVRERLSAVEREFARKDVIDARLRPLERDYARRSGRD